MQKLYVLRLFALKKTQPVNNAAAGAFHYKQNHCNKIDYILILLDFLQH